MYTIVLLGALTTADGSSGLFFMKKAYPTPVIDGHGCPGNHSYGGWGLPYGGYAWPGYACWGGCGGYASPAYGVPMSPIIRPAPYIPDPDEEKDRAKDKEDEKKKDKKKADDNKDLTPKKKDSGDNGDSDNASAAAPVPATVTFLLPQGTKLYVDDRPVAAADGTTFQTPGLQPGKRYYYEIKAEVVRNGKAIVQTRQIILTSGASIQADFRDMSVQGVASR